MRDDYTGCVGKRSFETAALARAVNKRRRKARTERRGQEAYKCRHCGMWHIGTRRQTVLRRDERKAMRYGLRLVIVSELI